MVGLLQTYIHMGTIGDCVPSTHMQPVNVNHSNSPFHECGFNLLVVKQNLLKFICLLLACSSKSHESESGQTSYMADKIRSKSQSTIFLIYGEITEVGAIVVHCLTKLLNPRCVI